MKHKLFLPLLAIVSGLLLLGCEEKPVIIELIGSGNTPDVPENRKVLVEELTGVRCPNCPDGTAALVSLGNQLGDALVVVSIHAAPGYDVPYPESQYDFRTADGTAMANFIGTASFFPSAAVNRRVVSSEIYLARQIWAGTIDQELAEEPVVGVSLETNFNPANRQLNVSVNITPVADLSEEHRLTVVITQDSIQDVQKKGLEKIPDYYHRHVMRDALTDATGDVIGALSAFTVVSKSFSITLPAGWDEKHCSVVAFVHHGTSPDKKVLQVEEKHIVE